MRKQLIESLIKNLRSSFGPVKYPISEKQLFEYYVSKDYHAMVAVVQKALCLDMTAYLGLVKSGGPPEAPAWVVLPENTPMIGSSAFRALRITMYIRKSFLETASFEAVVTAISHELSHMVLEGINHPLKKQEEAVDLTCDVAWVP